MLLGSNFQPAKLTEAERRKFVSDVSGLDLGG